VGRAILPAAAFQAVIIAAEQNRRIGEFGPIFAGFKVEVDGRGSGGNGVGQRRFSDLTGAGQGNGGLPRQSILNGGLCAAGIILAYYPCRG
jgi:hypothetical protein